LLCACWASNCWLESEPPTHSLTHAHNFVSVGIFTCTANPMWPGMHAPCICMHVQWWSRFAHMVRDGSAGDSTRRCCGLWEGRAATHTHTSGSNNVLRKCCSCWRCCVRANVHKLCEDGRFKKRSVLHTSQTTPPLTVEHRRPVESGSGQLRPTDTRHRRVAGTSETRLEGRGPAGSEGRSEF
jgi:hypothetical protein